MARACDICGSRKWRKDKVTGNAVCEEGHVQQDYRSEVNDMEIGGPRHQLTRRKVANKGERRNKRREEGRANPLFYHGLEAEYLRVQALQLLLRLQVQALSKLWSLPDAFEIIVRDLWAYQLSISILPSLPDILDQDQSQYGRSPSPFIITKQSQPSQSLPLDVEMVNNEERKSDDSQTGSEDENEKGDYDEDSEKESDLDPEILEQIEGVSDKEENSDQDGNFDNGRIGIQSRKGKRKKKLRISDTIFTLVMGLWILRIPVIGIDIENAINEMKIPYIDFYHTKYIPIEMKKHINRDVMISLSPLRSPSPSLIHRSCKDFARRLNKKYGIQIPEINVHPVIWRITSSLGGTPTTYNQVSRLLNVLDINLSLLEREINTFSRKIRSKSNTNLRDLSDDDDHFHNAIAQDSLEYYERTLLYQDVVAPELVIVSAWIIIMKIVYGLDGVPRETLLKSDPAIGLPRSKIWIDELKNRMESGIFKGGRRNLERQDFTSMDDDELDQLLNKAENVLLGDRAEPLDATPFPLISTSKVPESMVQPNSWLNYHADSTTNNDNLISRRSIEPIHDQGINNTNNKSLPLMPGEKILSFSANDPFLELPSDLELIVKCCSDLIGFSTEDVLIVVEHLEKKLEKIRPRDERGRKKEKETSTNEDHEQQNQLNRSTRTRSRSRSVSMSRSRPTSRSRTSTPTPRSRENSVSRATTRITRSRENSITRTRSQESNLSRVASMNNLNNHQRSGESSLSRTASLSNNLNNGRTNSQKGKSRSNVSGITSSNSFT
ncbi:uncharacterized protein L201_004784 [Kwoniella dendrophila CBS 6074]|uniref:RRN7-type domain-containing protein n=1 Tax=Kwoniella dendrophila CBS 6074 TaxID=1295534 RepID=A0AAX4JX81_9TREE